MTRSSGSQPLFLEVKMSYLPSNLMQNFLAGVDSGAGPGEGAGREQDDEAGRGSEVAEGLPGGDAGSGGRGVAS